VEEEPRQAEHSGQTADPASEQPSSTSQAKGEEGASSAHEEVRQVVPEPVAAKPAPAQEEVPEPAPVAAAPAPEAAAPALQASEVSLAVGSVGCDAGSHVEIAGSWDGWAGRVAMAYQQDKHAFTVSIPATVQPGEKVRATCTIPMVHPHPHSSHTLPLLMQYPYKYIVNGQWAHDPAQAHEVDGSGNTNNVLQV
jgi:hypothetical protein